MVPRLPKSIWPSERCSHPARLTRDYSCGAIELRPFTTGDCQKKHKRNLYSVYDPYFIPFGSGNNTDLICGVENQIPTGQRYIIFQSTIALKESTYKRFNEFLRLQGIVQVIKSGNGHGLLSVSKRLHELLNRPGDCQSSSPPAFPIIALYINDLYDSDEYSYHTLSHIGRTLA